MKKSLAHLPQHRQQELALIVETIRKKVDGLEMLILFGSYARGNWVEHVYTKGHNTYEYESDFDILVVTKTKKSAEDHNAQDRVEKAIDASNQVETPYSIIYHTFAYVKEMITEGRYFFTDIQKDGVYLYCADNHRLGSIKVLKPDQRKKIANEEFDIWFENAKQFYTTYELMMERKWHKKAAFNLHQATECFYGAFTLVFVNYRFRTHDLRLLNVKAVSYNQQFAEVFPRDTEEQRTAFNLLRRAYVDARYKKEYEITKDQLEYLAERVKNLQKLTESICRRKIESFV